MPRFTAIICFDEIQHFSSRTLHMYNPFRAHYSTKGDLQKERMKKAPRRALRRLQNDVSDESSNPFYIDVAAKFQLDLPKAREP